MIHSFLKVVGGFLLATTLISCGESTKTEVTLSSDTKTGSTIQISTEDLGKTQTGFTSDLKDLMDASYEKAADTPDQK